MEFSKKTRELSIKKKCRNAPGPFDYRWGITGAGVALQAAASGLETGLIEMQDFAEGTSSRSTKLVHGGLRYLKQFDVEVVSDTVSSARWFNKSLHTFQNQIQCSCQFTMRMERPLVSSVSK